MKEKRKNVQKIFKRVGAVMLAVFVLISMNLNTTLAAYYRYGIYSYSTGALWWKKKYNCTVYVEPGSSFLIWYGNNSVSTGFEYKKNTSLVLSQTNSFTIESQTVVTLNPGVDIEACGISFGIGGSISRTTSQKWGISNTSVRTIERTDPEGYYSYNVCMNIKKIKVTGTAKGTVYINAPASEPYRAVVYNEKNALYSGATRF